MASRNASARSYTYILLGGYATLLVVFILAGVLPYLHGVMTADADSRKSLQEIELRRAQARELEDVKAQVELIKAQTKDYSRLISTEEPSLFTGALSKFLEESNATEVVFLGIQKQLLAHSEKAPIEVHFHCTYDQCYQFLKRMESMERLSSVGRLTINADTDMSGKVEVQLLVFVYNVKATP